MYIKASAAIRNNYNEIAQLCKETGEPVYLTKNGEGDLVVMDIAAFERRENMMKLNYALEKVQVERSIGEVGYTIDETIDRMRQAIKEVPHV